LSTDSHGAGQSTGSPVQTLLAPPSHDAALRPGPWRGQLDFDALYEEHFPLVWRTARRLGVPESAAADVVQDVFLVVHRRLADYDGQTPVKYWLLGIVTRVVTGHRRTYFRKDSRCVPPDVDKDGAETMASPDPAPLEQVERAETLRLVVSLMDELDPDKREVLVLAEFEEMSAVEIAQCLGLNVNTVYGRIRAARRAFDEAHARHRARTARRSP
jgi:RNA polymerase sigma-70 factor (ECF subfamily)